MTVRNTLRNLVVGFALLACAVCVPSMRAAGAVPAAEDPSVETRDPLSSDWSADLARFAAEDAATPPPAAPVVFTGSSSVRMWDTLKADFPGMPVMNRGFGGSHVRDATHHAEAVALRYRPRTILLYAGDNDIDAGHSPRQVAHDFRAFVARVRRALPETRIGFLAIKPSLARAGQLPRQQEANALVRSEAARLHEVVFIDVATPMLGADGQPRPELFAEDRLHMNAAGYALWKNIVAPYLQQAGQP